MQVTPRERFLATMQFEPVDRPVLWESGLWENTRQAWMEQGMEGEWPPEFSECDPIWSVPVNFGPMPPHERVVLSEDEETTTYIDDRGITRRELKLGADLSMPQFIDYPVRSREDWEKRVAWRYDPDTPGRFPDNWAELVAGWRDRQVPLQVSAYPHLGMMGPIRDLMGIERMAPLFYDDPELIHDIAHDWADFIVRILERILNDVIPDVVNFWEDICYHSAPLVSPRTFREFFVPHYRRINDMLIEAGVPLRGVDTDGDARLLVEPLMDSGINYLWPLEVAAHMDARELRRKYGKALVMHGNIDKRAIAAGPPVIDQELEAKIPVALEGGFIPICDHSMPPDITYQAFQYYWRRKKEMLGVA